MFALVVTCRKGLADDKAVLLSNTHHGLRLSKPEAGCIVSALHKTERNSGLVFLFIGRFLMRLF